MSTSSFTPVNDPETSTPPTTRAVLGAASDYANGNPGGFINKKHTRVRIQKMKWTAENDRRLLLIGLGKEINSKEYQQIADLFPDPEQPTAKSIQERLTKLRAEQMKLIDEMGNGVKAPEAIIAPLEGLLDVSPIMPSGSISSHETSAVDSLLNELSSIDQTTPEPPKKIPKKKLTGKDLVELGIPRELIEAAGKDIIEKAKAAEKEGGALAETPSKKRKLDVEAKSEVS